MLPEWQVDDMSFEALENMVTENYQTLRILDLKMPNLAFNANSTHSANFKGKIPIVS
jgi:hypothetical protein